MYIEYHGFVSIDYWEYLLSFLYVVVLYLYFARVKNIFISNAPEYKYFLWGLLAKIAGGVGFCMIYFYYYRGGDTTMYYYSAVSFSNLGWHDPLKYLDVLFGEATEERMGYFTVETGRPYRFMYFMPRNLMMVRLISVISLFTFKSYLVTTVVIASLAYFGVWRCFRTFVGYFPALTPKLAIAFLFMPSVVFWGSAIMKDTFTFTALCWFVHCADEWFFKKHRWVSVVVGGLISATLIIALKPYMFVALVPAMAVWVMYRRLIGLRNKLVKFVLVPIGFLVLFGGLTMFLTLLGDKLDKFSLDTMLDTIVITKNDLQRAEEYGGNYFDIGELDNTWSSVISKAPIAITAAFYRPFIWEVSNVVMLLSAMENLWLLLFTVRVLLATRIFGLQRYVLGNPIVFMFFGFAVLFAFGIGVSTPNFGALVRFKIPLIPFFVGGLYIIQHLVARKRQVTNAGRRFELKDYIDGDPDPTPPRLYTKHRRAPKVRPIPMAGA
jgi:hypothetical protein